MQIISNHRLNEDFIDKMDAEEVVQNNAVSVEESKFEFSYLLDYRIEKDKFKQKDTEDILYKIFIRLVTMLPLLRHIDEIGTPKVCIEDDYISKENFDYLGREMRLDAQGFRVLTEEYKHVLESLSIESGYMELSIEVPFKTNKVSYKTYVSDINQLHGALLYSLRHDVRNGTLDLAFWDSWDQPYYIVSTSAITAQIEIQSAYLVLFDSKEELQHEEFNRIVYRSQRLPLFRTLMYIEDNPDCFKGYRTQIIGGRVDTNQECSTCNVFMRVFPKNEDCWDTERIFNIGQKIINSLKSSDIYNLRKYNDKSQNSIVYIWISVPGDCYDALRKAETQKLIKVNDDIDGRITIMDLNF